MSNSDTCLGENEIEFGDGVTEEWAKTVGRVAGESLSEEVMFGLTRTVEGPWKDTVTRLSVTETRALTQRELGTFEE